jgi:copper resistance protein D
MHGLYLLSVWLHIMAAVVWVGGTIFLVIVLVPAIRRREFGGIASALIRFTAFRFRWVGWVCFCVFVLTGIVNLAARGIGWQELQDATFWQGSFGSTLAIKLMLVATILLISAVSRVFPRAARGGGVGGRCGFSRDASPETASGTMGQAQSAAGFSGDFAGHHARARRA